MIRNKEIKSIIHGIQEKKGRNIRVVDLRKIEDTICNFLVICEGGSPNQVSAIADSVEDIARKEVSIKPVFVDGLTNSFWVAMDYSDIVVHVFLPEERAFYDLDHLWEDGKVYDVPDLD
ncbi:MAG: ribosome silencing factor [Bacteroidaceae bacterium]|nr:ribosome silencing factor [Bacteroidaceae bacterium]